MTDHEDTSDFPQANRVLSRLVRDRRVQIGGAAILSAALIATVAMVVLGGSRAQPAGPDLAEHARLSILTQAPPEDRQRWSGKLETLSPEQRAARQAPSMDPEQAADLAAERSDQHDAAADQQAFDTPRAERQDVPAAPSDRPSGDPDNPGA
jgi:type IV secretory pathway VirB10-like protein